MARKLRIHYPGALYHVMVRGNNRENVFIDGICKSNYLSILSRYKMKMSFKLYAFCLMDNHAHLLIEVGDDPLSRIMQRIQQVYTQWFNRSFNRTGHVFQQRYKALLCNKESYLLQLIKYIHNNPVKANLDDGIRYKWSSHNSYISLEKNSLVNTSEVLSIFSDNRNRAIRQYLQFMSEVEEVETPIEHFHEFNTEILTTEKKTLEKEKKLSIDEIIEKVCINEDIEINEIIKRTKIQKISDIRKAIVLLSERYCSATNSMIAQKLNLPLSMISKIKSGISRRTAYVNDVIEKWEQIRE